MQAKFLVLVNTGAYPVRPPYPPGNYGSPPAAPNVNNANPSQFPGRVAQNQPPTAAPFGSNYQQAWPPSGMPANTSHPQNKGAPVPANSSGAPRPLNHLKQHLLHKGNYSGGQSPTSPQGFANGPGLLQPMGPPQVQGHPGMGRVQVKDSAHSSIY